MRVEPLLRYSTKVIYMQRWSPGAIGAAFTSPNCRDKVWCSVWRGSCTCPSSLSRQPNKDKHKAPSHPLRRPLSLRQRLFDQLCHHIESRTQLRLVLAAALRRFGSAAAFSTQAFTNGSGNFARVHSAFCEFRRDAHLQTDALAESGRQHDNAGFPQLLQHHVAHLAQYFVVRDIRGGSDNRNSAHLLG